MENNVNALFILFNDGFINLEENVAIFFKLMEGLNMVFGILSFWVFSQFLVGFLL